MNDECEMMNEAQPCFYIHHSSFRIHHFLVCGRSLFAGFVGLLFLLFFQQ